MSDKYKEWAKNWETGMRASADKTARRREDARAVAVFARAQGAKTLCGVKGCKRHAYKGRICRMHYEQVPAQDRFGLAAACALESRKIAARWHKRFLADLNRRA